MMYDGDKETFLGKKLEIFSLHQARYEASSKMDMSTSFNSVDHQARDTHSVTSGEVQHREEKHWLCKVIRRL